jgi:hypothetical protein
MGMFSSLVALKNKKKLIKLNFLGMFWILKRNSQVQIIITFNSIFLLLKKLYLIYLILKIYVEFHNL